MGYLFDLLIEIFDFNASLAPYPNTNHWKVNYFTAGYGVIFANKCAQALAKAFNVLCLPKIHAVWVLFN